MFERNKRTGRSIFTIGLILVGGMLVAGNSYAASTPACVCGPGYTQKICIPHKNSEEAMKKFCLQEGKARQRLGEAPQGDNPCPLNMNAGGCGSNPRTAWPF